MVIGIDADFFEVVVLAGDTDALLTIGSAAKLRRAMAKEDLLKLVHSRIGKQQRLITNRHHRPTRYKPMALFRKEINKRTSNFV